jgi:hypothetical protein
VTDETAYGHYKGSGGTGMPTHATEDMIWAHLAEVRRQARAAGWHPAMAGEVERRPLRAVVGEWLVGVGLRLMAKAGPSAAAVAARR